MEQRISRRRLLAALPVQAGLLGAFARLTYAKARVPRVGCQANGFPLKAGDFPALLKALETMKSLGYEGFECNIRFVRDQFSRAAEARRQIKSTGVIFIGAHHSMQEAESEAFPQVAEGVAALGAECIVMSGRGLAPDGKFQPEALKQKAAALDALAKTCHAKGIRLAYHNHNPEFANHNAEMEGLAASTDPELVEFLMDAGHAHLGGGEPAEFMLRHSKRILGCHLKTFKNNDVKEQVPLGQGDFDFEDLAAAVKKTGWAGWLIDEEGGGPKPGDTAALGPDRQHIRKLFGV